MIRGELLADFQYLDNAAALARQYPRLVSDAAQDTLEDIRPALLEELAIEPGPVHYPIEWTSEKQRKAFFASDGFGKGIPYKRTGGATKGWKADITVNDNAVVFGVSNPNKYLRYVRGRLGGRTGNQIQQFHKNTGWTESAPIITRHIERAKQLFLQRFYARVDQFLKR